MSDIYIRDSENDLTYSESAGGYVLTSSLFDSYTLTIVPTPEDATVVISADGYSQSGNSLTAIEGTYVAYTVSKTGYRTVSGSVTLDSDKTISVSLVPSSIDNIDDAKTVRELEVNDTAYDIVGKGVLDQNNRTTNLEWIGTKAEYEALGVYADYCTYIITDDSADSQSDEVGAIAEEVNTLKGYDYVVDWQAPTSTNNYTWYRKYKSGWVEQGGRSIGTLSGNVFSLTLLVPMANQEYYFNILPVLDNSDTGSYFARGITQTTTKIQYYMFLNNAVTPNNPIVEWMVCGMAA